MDSRYPSVDRRLSTVDTRVAALAVVLALLVGTLVLQTLLQVLAVVAGTVTMGITLSDPRVVLLVLPVTQLTFLVVGLAVLRRRGGVPIRRLSPTDAAWVGGGLAVKFALFGGFQAVNGWLGIHDLPDLLTQATDAEPRLLVVVAVLSLVLIGPSEELFFRGAIQGRLREAFGVAAAVLLAAFLFAAPHLLNYVVGGATPFTVGALIDVGTVFLTGCVMGYAYERTGNLTVPILLHGLYDASIFLAVYLGLLVL